MSSLTHQQANVQFMILIKIQQFVDCLLCQGSSHASCPYSILSLKMPTGYINYESSISSSNRNIRSLFETANAKILSVNRLKLVFSAFRVFR